METIKETFLFLRYLLMVIMPIGVSAQDASFPIGRKWVCYDKLLNPYAEPSIISYTVSDYKVINDKEYSYIRGVNYCKDGSRILKYGKIYIEEKDTTIYGDMLVLDESWEIGDTTTWRDDNAFNEDSLKWLTVYETVVDIGYLNGLKYWDLELNGWKCTWLQSVGYIKGGRDFFEEYNRRVGGPFTTVICCVDSNGDTLYVDRDALQLLPTGISNISADDIYIAQLDGECVVSLPAASEWTATLYNAAGVSVAHKSGECGEIILPTESKGTHILVLDVDGKQYTKKVVIK